jgi:hypothetical protein
MFERGYPMEKTEEMVERWMLHHDNVPCHDTLQPPVFDR